MNLPCPDFSAKMTFLLLIILHKNRPCIAISILYIYFHKKPCLKRVNTCSYSKQIYDNLMAVHDWIAPVDRERTFCAQFAGISCL